MGPPPLKNVEVLRSFRFERILINHWSSGIVGYVILIASRDAGLSYFAVYLAAFAIYPTLRESSHIRRCHRLVLSSFLELS